MNTDSLLRIDYLYYLIAIILLVAAFFAVRDKANPRRWSSGLFWGIYGLLFVFSPMMPPAIVGLLVLVMAVIAGLGGVGKGRYNELSEAQRKTKALQLHNKLFIPALAIPVVTIVCAMLLKDVQIGGLRVFQLKNETLLGLGMACIIGLTLACAITREGVGQSLQESRRLLEAMGWAVALPQMLAILGILFTDAGVGKAVSYLATSYLAMDMRLVAVAAYCIGMAVFTMIMGNAFAAFPVITAGIGIPALLVQHHGNPAVMAAIGMFSGYCGTLMTPMAANFNIVPAALLDLKDKNAVVKAQVATAIPLLLCNIALMYFLMFR